MLIASPSQGEYMSRVREEHDESVRTTTPSTSLPSTQPSRPHDHAADPTNRRPKRALQLQVGPDQLSTPTQVGELGPASLSRRCRERAIDMDLSIRGRFA